MNAHLADVLGTSATEGNGKALTVYVVRHGATRMNNQTDMSEDRIRGWKDVPLVEEGREEARKAALKLKGKDIGAIVASDLCRASETAEIIGKIIGLKPELSQGLRPWNLGHMTGQTTKEALPVLAEYVRNKPDEAVPEGESFNEFKARAFQGFAEAIAKHPGKVILLVTHHRDERLIAAWDEAGQPEDHSIELDVFLQKGDPPGGVRTLRTSEAALKGSSTPFDKGSGAQNGQSMKDYAAINDHARSVMADTNVERENKSNPAGRFKSKWAQTGKMPAQDASAAGPRADMTDVMAHGRAIAGAKALHAVGHINEKQRDRHIKASQKAIGGSRKPFGAFAP